MPVAPTPPPGPWLSTGFLETSLCPLQYAECGQGPTVIMLPKLGGWIADWRHVANLLAPSFRIIVIDPPGHGGSKPETKPPYLHSVPESAALIMAGLDRLGVSKFHLVGNSLGGCIGIAMANFFPTAIERLVLVGVSLADQMTYAEIAARDAELLADSFDPNGQPKPRTAMELARFGPLREDTIAEQNASRAACGVWLRPSERGVGRMGISNYLPRLQMPVLLINGALGYYAKYLAVAEQKIPNVTCVTIPQAGPFLHQESPAIVASLIADFLDAA